MTEQRLPMGNFAEELYSGQAAGGRAFIRADERPAISHPGSSRNGHGADAGRRR